MEILKSKIFIASAIYTVLAWISALLFRFNSGKNDTYSLIVFVAYVILSTFGLYIMYVVVVISFLVTFIREKRGTNDKIRIRNCCYYSLLSLFLISSVYLTYRIMDFAL